MSLNLKIYLVASVILLLGMFINLGVQPIFLEEPRRAMIAMEMMENGNWLVPTQLGVDYHKKPPGFNWVLMISRSIAGTDAEITWRIPTILSIIAIALLLFFVGRKYLDFETGLLTALLFTCSGGILFYFSLLGEIDLFYAFVTLLGLMGIFHFDKQQQPYRLFLALYISGALGFLTKGFPSIVFIGLSLLAYFGVNRRWRILFSIPHFTGMLAFALLIGGYLYGYNQSGDLNELFAVLWGESSQRTATEHGLLDRFSHLFNFPVQTLIDTLPGSLLLFFLFIPGALKKCWEHPFIRFCLVIFLANYAIYCLAPGARQRYVYMLYPFLLFIGAFTYISLKPTGHRLYRIFNIVVKVVLGLLPLAAISIIWIPAFSFLTYRVWIGLIFSMLFGGIFFLTTIKKWPGLPMLLLAIGMVRVLFDLTILPQRAQAGDAFLNKQLAYEVQEIVGDAPLHVWPDSRFSFTTVFYLNKLRGQTIRQSNQIESTDYYLAKLSVLPEGYETLLNFEYQGEAFALVKFKYQ